MKLKMMTYLKCVSLSSGIILLLILFSGELYAQNTVTADTADSLKAKKDTSRKKKSFKMTTLTFGGNGLNITRVRDQVTIMTGGRGSATFNKRYTIGGGGWGMIKGVAVESNTDGTYSFIKMGFGGIDLGYLILPGEKLNIGTKMLLGGGAVFREQVPESKDKEFKMFPVLEPTLYYQISLSKLFRFEMGASYRYIWGTNLSYASEHDLKGFSCYAGFLVRACKCD
jgi:hypothetical protein